MTPFTLSLDLSGILQSGIIAVFQLFGEFISYLINIPTPGWTYIAMIFASSISQYNEFILPMLIIILGITFLTTYTIISTAKTVDSDVDLGALMEGIEWQRT